MKQEIGHGIVGNENVLPSVIIVIECNNAEPVSRLCTNARLFADVRESAIAIIAIQSRRLAIVIVGMAIAAHARTVFAAPEIAIRRPVDVIRDDEIKMTIIIIVKPRGAGGPSASISYTRALRNVSESAVSVVVVQNAAAVSENKQIGKAIIVVIPYS